MNVRKISASASIALLITIGMATPAIASEEVAPSPDTLVIEEASTAPTAEAATQPTTATPEVTTPTLEATPVTAAPDKVKPEKKTVSHKWFMPGSTGQVTWPQFTFSDQFGWCQIDLYDVSTPKKQAQYEAIIADGILTGATEDGGLYISHVFEPCGTPPVVVPEKPADTMTEASSESTDCDTDTVTTTRTVITIGTELVNNAWVPTEPVSVETVTTREATDLECPVVVPPTEEPPVVTPPVVEPPVVTPPAVEEPVNPVVAAPATPQAEGKLAFTGSKGNVEGAALLAGLLFGAGLLLVGRSLLRRKA